MADLGSSPTDRLRNCLEAVSGEGNIIRMDGKTLRGSRRDTSLTALPIAIVAAQEARIVLSWEGVEEGEVTQVAPSSCCKGRPYKGKSVTLDARLTQREIAREVVEKEGLFREREITERFCRLWWRDWRLREEISARLRGLQGMELAKWAIRSSEVLVDESGSGDTDLFRAGIWPACGLLVWAGAPSADTAQSDSVEHGKGRGHLWHTVRAGISTFAAQLLDARSLVDREWRLLGTGCDLSDRLKPRPEDCSTNPRLLVCGNPSDSLAGLCLCAR